MITNQRSDAKLDAMSKDILSLNKILILDCEEDRRKIEKQPKEPLAVNIAPSHLAYMIYTSGTSAKPNWVMIEHRSVVNYIVNVGNIIHISDQDIIDFSTSVAFDLTVTTTLVKWGSRRI